MELQDTTYNTGQEECGQCSGYQHHITITKQSINEDHDHHPPPNRKRQLSCDNEDELYVPALKKANSTHHRIGIIIPIMAKRLQHTIATYSHWRMNGFDIVLIFNENEEKEIRKILCKLPKCVRGSFVMHSYTTRIPPNAGIAKHEAYNIVKEYLNRPDFQFVLLLDDTLKDIVDTCTGKSIMITPTTFYRTVEKFAIESPIFGGTVAYERFKKRHKKGGIKRNKQRCKKEGLKRVKGAFLQQALIFSCRGTMTLKMNVDKYIAKMRALSYRKVPFGEDIAFQVSLYEKKVLSKVKSPQFWGIGILRIPHKSSTKPAFDQLEDSTKEEIKQMLIYLDEQNALSTNPKDELMGVRVIPGGPIRIPITGREGERPWREAFNDTFNAANNNKDLVNKRHC